MNEIKRVNRSRYVILGMLARGEASGYDLRRQIESSTGYFWTESLGQIYPTLEKLRREGAVRKQADRRSARRRIVYSLTAQGLKELKQWLEKPYSPPVERNELLLKIFFSGTSEPQIAIEHLSRARQEARSYVDLLHGISRSLIERLPNQRDRLFYEATLRAGIYGAEAQIRWSEETEVEIRRTFGIRPSSS